ncbi:MAG: site-2 protease family protein [Haloarculaceae archaeon]
MVDTLVLVLAGVVLYTVLATVLDMRGLLPESIRISGPITTLHTQRGRDFLEWLSGPTRFWRAWGNFGVGIALVVMVGSFLLVGFAGVQAVTNPQPTALNEPRNVLAIPGVNQFLPLSAAVEIVAGLVIGLVVHEGGHGLMCRVEDIDIESLGLAFLAFIPVGAFVEPDEDSRRRASRGGQTRMFAAGVTNNFAVTVIAFALLFGPVAGSISVVAGVPVGGVLPGSAAGEAGLDRGDVVGSVDGVNVSGSEEFDAALAAAEDRTVRLGLKRGGTVEVERALTVTGAAAGAPADVNTTITAVNGTAVYTEEAFRSAVEARPVATLDVREGEDTRRVTTPLGAYTLPMEGEAFAAAGAPVGEPVIVTSIGGERVVDNAALSSVLEGYAPEDEVEVVGYVGTDGDRRTWNVTFGSQPDGSGGAFLGVSVQAGVSGLAVDDLGVDVYPAGTFLGALGGEGGEGPNLLPGGGPIRRAYVALVLPFARLTIPGLGYSFAGFVGPVANFYDVSGPLGLLGTGAGLFLANLLFWTAWINLIIGQFNCIPAYPLDGGHILRTSTETVVSRLPIENGRAVTRAVTTTVSLVMLAGVFLMVFGPRLLT